MRYITLMCSPSEDLHHLTEYIALVQGRLALQNTGLQEVNVTQVVSWFFILCPDS